MTIRAHGYPGNPVGTATTLALIIKLLKQYPRVKYLVFTDNMISSIFAINNSNCITNAKHCLLEILIQHLI